MITICLLPAILGGTADRGWNLGSKIGGLISVLLIDSIYLIPMFA